MSSISLLCLECASRMEKACHAGQEGADGGLDAGESFGVGAVHACAASTILVGRVSLMCSWLALLSTVKAEHIRPLQIRCWSTGLQAWTFHEVWSARHVNHCQSALRNWSRGDSYRMPL